MDTCKVSGAAPCPLVQYDWLRARFARCEKRRPLCFALLLGLGLEARLGGGGRGQDTRDLFIKIKPKKKQLSNQVALPRRTEA
jgi:hypothetical protein